MATYETDFYAWTQEQAALLKAGTVEGLDFANLADEIQSLGGEARRQLRDRINVLLLNLLKWQYQREYRCTAWASFIGGLRAQLDMDLEDCRTFQCQLPAMIKEEFSRAVEQALAETGLYQVPVQCPWTPEQVRDPNFYPELA